METELIKHQRITAMAAQFEKAMSEIKEMLQLYETSQGRLTKEFGTRCSFSYSLKSDIENAPAEMKRAAWRYILRQSQVLSFVSIKRNEEIDKQIEEDQLPDITEKNIVATLQSFIGDSSSLLDETVKEVFAWLRPWRDEYKTNMKFKIGKKVIKDYMVTHWSGPFDIRYGSETELTAMDNAFHLLDGKGIKRHPENLVSKVKTAMKTEPFFEDDMFKIKWYLKGTMHIEFKRDDLLKKLNQIGAGNNSQVGDREYTRKKYDLVKAV